MSKRAVEKSLAHWKRMLAWAKKRDPRDAVWYSEMDEAISEGWYDRDCALCGENPEYCERCELHRAGYYCCVRGSPWYQVNSSLTWGTWCQRAQKMIRVLERILEEKKHV